MIPGYIIVGATLAVAQNAVAQNNNTGAGANIRAGASPAPTEGKHAKVKKGQRIRTPSLTRWLMNNIRMSKNWHNLCQNYPGGIIFS